MVASVGGEHNCIGAGQIGYGPSSQQTWLQRILPTTLVVSKSTSPREIVDAVKLHHHISTYDAAKKVIQRVHLHVSNSISSVEIIVAKVGFVPSTNLASQP